MGPVKDTLLPHELCERVDTLGEREKLGKCSITYNHELKLHALYESIPRYTLLRADVRPFPHPLIGP